MSTPIKLFAVSVGVGCFALAATFPDHSTMLIEAGVGVLVLAGVAVRVKRGR